MSETGLSMGSCRCLQDSPHPAALFEGKYSGVKPMMTAPAIYSKMMEEQSKMMEEQSMSHS
ncbi:hypothetical protein C2W62_26835 [Candidatus Entotheonella serta]|nr:hypothetical protein C2W62_26835 [Candidatus Entotheonella serta]